MAVNFFRSKEEKVALERWIRGREQFSKLQKADCVIVSFGKSGRTWLRVMLSRYCQLKYGIPEGTLLGFDNFHHMNSEVPKIFFTHDNYIKDYSGNADNKKDYIGKKVVLLVRHPADVTVSQYFQWRYRMRPKKKDLNLYPAHGTDVSLKDFVINSDAGLGKVIDFMNIWADALDYVEPVLVVRYEDMQRDPEGTLSKLVDFMGIPGSADTVTDAVAYASVENMRALEQKKTFRLSGGRMKAKDPSNPDSFKVRRAKVGGYRDYFDASEMSQIDAIIDQRLARCFGYTAIGDKAQPDVTVAVAET